MKEHKETFNLLESIQSNLKEARKNPEINKDNKNKDTGVEYDTSKDNIKRNKVSKTKSQTWEVNPNRRSRICKELKDKESSQETENLKNLVKKDISESISLDEGMSIDEAIKELVAGGELYFRYNDDNKPYIAVYADNYPEPEEYDEGFKIENGGNEEQLAKVKQAADEGNVWEFKQVDEETLEPNGEDSFLAYGEDDLRETLQYLHQVNIIKRLEEDDDLDFYNYLKSELLNGNIDDLDYIETLNDEELDDLIRNTYMKDPEEIKNWERIKNEFSLNEDDSVEVVDEQLNIDDFINELVDFLKDSVLDITDVNTSDELSSNTLRVISFKLNDKDYYLRLIER